MNKRWSPVLRQGEPENLPAGGPLVHAPKGTAALGMQNEPRDAISIITFGQEEPYQSGSNGAGKSNEQKSAHSLLTSQQHSQAPVIATKGWFLPTEQVVSKNMNHTRKYLYSLGALHYH